MATVYLARDLKHDRDVAIKVLRPDIGQTLGVERFLREIQLAAKLSHPHILPLFDSGEAAGALYYVMPCIEGHSVRDRLNASQQLPVDEAVRIASEVAGALDYAHRHGVVHRDIKPENIMLQDGHALVADFGIGKALSAIEGEAFTQTGMSVGTPAYMSPEQASGDPVDGRSDLYSLGCVLYEMLVGEQPFTGPTVQSVIAKRFVQTPAEVTALRDGIRRPVARAVQRALARTPIDRYDTAAEFAAALQQADATPEASRSAAPERSIAVLPFATMSHDPDNVTFADGITEEILNALAQIPVLRVAGRTSSFSFKGRNLDLQAVGEQLKVRTVLEGSVRRSGKRVRITAQLIDVTDGYHLWSERYDREIEDVFAVQDEIAAAIAAKMKTTLAGGAAARAQRATHSIEAYEAFLKGRSLLYRRGASILEGLALMEKALALDPEYGLAWAGIAEGFALLGYYGLITPEAARAKVALAANKAVAFAPDLAEAHCALGVTSLMFEWDWARAGQAFKRGMELNPGSTQGATWYYLFYLGWFGGKVREGVEGLKGLIARDEMSGYLTGMISILAASMNDPSCEQWAARSLQLDPEAFLSRLAHQLSRGAMEDWPETIAASEALFAVGGRSPIPLVTYGVARARLGDAAGARAVYDEIVMMTGHGERSPMSLAILAAALGDTEAAGGWLRAAYTRKDPQMVVMGLNGFTVWNAVRQLPEFEQIRTELKLPEWVERHPR